MQHLPSIPAGRRVFYGRALSARPSRATRLSWAEAAAQRGQRGRRQEPAQRRGWVVAKRKGVSAAHSPGATRRTINQSAEAGRGGRGNSWAGRNPLFCTPLRRRGLQVFPAASSRFQAGEPGRRAGEGGTLRPLRDALL